MLKLLVAIALLMFAGCCRALPQWTPAPKGDRRALATASGKTCMIEGNRMPFTEARFDAAFHLFRACRNPAWRRVILVTEADTSPREEPAYYPAAELFASWRNARDELRRASQNQECVMVLDFRDIESAFLVSVQGVTFAGCVTRHVRSSQEEAWRLWPIEQDTPHGWELLYGP